MPKKKRNKCHWCRLEDCPYFTRAYQDLDDLIGEGWCELAGSPLPDEETYPFNCIAREELAELEDES